MSSSYIVVESSKQLLGWVSFQAFPLAVATKSVDAGIWSGKDAESVVAWLRRVFPGHRFSLHATDQASNRVRQTRKQESEVPISGGPEEEVAL